MTSRVLHVIPSVGTVRGGTTTVVRQMTSDLAGAGVETHVATTDYDGDSRRTVVIGKPVVEGGVTYWYFPRQTRFYTCSWPMHVWLAQQVSSFQLVHIHALFSFSSLAAGYAAAKCGVPYVVTPHGMLLRWSMQNRRPWLKAASFRMFERRILAGAALVQYTSAQERDEATALGTTTRSAVIPNALASDSPAGDRTSWLARHPELRDRRIVLFLSRIDPKKGLDLLIHAFAEVRQHVPDARLVVAGDGPEDFVKQMKALTARLNIASEVVWPGFINGELKRSALAAADVFVLPSYSENFGMAAAEAMAAGVPTVISENVAIQGDVHAAGAALVVPCDAGKVADALMAVLRSTATARSLSHRGRQFAEGEYSSARVTQRVMDAYEDVLSSHSKASLTHAEQY
jgi:glycosyltransferase involved in cell wall biosynthesis